MEKRRKDSKGYALNLGESQRKDGYYIFQYQDLNHKRRTIYAKTLVDLRKKEKLIQKDILDGINTYTAEMLTLNDMFDRYINTKLELRESTRTNYIYMYKYAVRESFGKRKLNTIKYSDVKDFYFHLLFERNYQANTLETVHTIIHPVFSLSIREGLIRVNPSDGVMAEIKKSSKWEVPKRHALTIPQQKAFTNYIKNSVTFRGWLPMMVVLLGTGMRIGECLGLTWDDVDLENRVIHVRHMLIYRIGPDGKMAHHITLPKTKAGIRDIPMFDDVYHALQEERLFQESVGFCKDIVDGYTGFVFSNRFQKVNVPYTVNKAIKRIYTAYNAEEEVKAAEEGRPPVLIPHFSAHHLRHTFCTRLCENESNVKVIQTIMGHSDYATTMEIYADVTQEKKKETFKNLEGKMSLF